MQLDTHRLTQTNSGNCWTHCLHFLSARFRSSPRPSALCAPPSVCGVQHMKGTPVPAFFFYSFIYNWFVSHSAQVLCWKWLSDQASWLAALLKIAIGKIFVIYSPFFVRRSRASKDLCQKVTRREEGLRDGGGLQRKVSHGFIAFGTFSYLL